jgi:hypothetical protein
VVSVNWISDHVRDITSVDIQLSLDDGANFSTVAASEANDGTYTWSVPDVYSTNARIRVLARDSSGMNGSDQSDVSFTINGTQQRNGDFDGDGIVSNNDLGIMLLEWGVCEILLDCPSDLNRDGVTDTGDMGFLLLSFGDAT